MDKLISANSIMQKLISILNENGDMYLAGRIIGVIDSEPVAFDKEKVIEELKQEAEDSRKIWHRFDDEHAIGEVSAYIRAIEIVDKGGIEQ